LEFQMLLRHRLSRRLATTLTATLAAATTALSGVALTAAPAQAAEIVTPGNFTGYGFDQCLAPSQSAMDTWLRSSPFLAVGIYISGDSRYCRSQPNLTPTWVDTQLRSGWRLLPITLGPQAWCTTRDRYLKQERINPDATRGYSKARAQGRDEAREAVGVATGLGIAPGSTLWYDIEAFDISRTDCRESALSFLSAWTNQLHARGYVSGVYSSAGSGVKMLDDAQTDRPGQYAMPDQIWVARWSGVPGQVNDARTTYLRETSWMPHRRVHQYRGGHNETHGGVTINIDSNWLDLGTGSVAPAAKPLCGGVPVDFADYPALRLGAEGDLVRAAQCLLKRKHVYAGQITGVYDNATAAATRAFRAKIGLAQSNTLSRRAWTAVLSRGRYKPLMKYGVASDAVRRLQRGLNAADRAGLPVTGVFGWETTEAVKRYQADHGLAGTGVVLEDMWELLKNGVR
jgi:peptidoglycan hydrolase-like protein with peptidoglycan-binding domain